MDANATRLTTHSMLINHINELELLFCLLVLPNTMNKNDFKLFVLFSLQFTFSWNSFVHDLAHNLLSLILLALKPLFQA